MSAPSQDLRAIIVHKQHRSGAGAFRPPQFRSKPRNPYFTNVRAEIWREWKGGGGCIWAWFAQDESRPLMFFASGAIRTRGQ